MGSAERSERIEHRGALRATSLRGQLVAVAAVASASSAFVEERLGFQSAAQRPYGHVVPSLAPLPSFVVLPSFSPLY
jgi:hypothetical protein